MRIWGTSTCTAALLAACLAGGSALTGSVELVNGDTLTGEIVEQNERGIVLKHPVLGTVAIAADRIKAIKPDPPGPGPKPEAKPAEPKPAKQPAPPEPKPAAPKPADAAEVQAGAEQAAKTQDTGPFDWLLNDWKSQLTLGLNGAGGNTDRQNYHVKLNSKHEDGRDRWTVNAAWFYGVANGNTTQNQFQTDLTKDWLKKDSPWFFFLKGTYRYDQKRAWENRTSAFGGGGYTLAKTDDVEINTRLGFGGTYEYGEINDFTPEALFGGSVLKWKVSDRAAISGETIYYPSLEDAANFRIESKLQWAYKLDFAKGLSLKLGVENEYDSRTPNDNSNNDLKYYGALVLSF